MDGDNLAHQQVSAADQQGNGGNLTHGAAALAQEHAHHAGQVTLCTALDDCHRGSCGECVNCLLGIGDDADLAVGSCPGSHGYRPGSQQECTAGQRRVDEVFAQAAKQALCEDDGNAVTDNQHPVRKGYRADKCQQHAGNSG